MPGTPIHPEKDEDTEVVPLAPTPPDEPKGSRTRPAELTHLHPDDAGTMDGGKPVGEPLSPSPKSREESGAPRRQAGTGLRRNLRKFCVWWWAAGQAYRPTRKATVRHIRTP